LSWGSEEALPFADLDYFRVTDLPIRAAKNYLEEVTVGSDWRRRHIPELAPGHVILGDCVVYPVDLDLEVGRLLLFLFPSNLLLLSSNLVLLSSHLLLFPSHLLLLSSNVLLFSSNVLLFSSNVLLLGAHLLSLAACLVLPFVVFVAHQFASLGSVPPRYHDAMALDKPGISTPY
jgi:hypothetical protein